MTVAHASLTDPNLHEPKGAAAAAAGEFLIADGAGGTDFIKRVFKLTATLTPALVAANTTAEQLFTVSGVLLASDVCAGVSKPTCDAGLGIVGWRVSADNQVAITFVNATAGGLTPTAAQVYSFVIYRT